MDRLSRINRTAEDLGILNQGGLMDCFDNVIKSAYRINDAEYDYLAENLSDDELGLLVIERPNFATKRKILNLLKEYMIRFNSPLVQYKFVKEEDRWYIVLPEWQGLKSDLQMVLGADTMLDIISSGGTEVYLTISDHPFTLKDTGPLETLKTHKLIKKYNTPEDGGAIYYLKSWYGLEVNIDMWLCSVTEAVFGRMPETIYIA